MEALRALRLVKVRDSFIVVIYKLNTGRITCLAGLSVYLSVCSAPTLSKKQNICKPNLYVNFFQCKKSIFAVLVQNAKCQYIIVRNTHKNDAYLAQSADRRTVLTHGLWEFNAEIPVSGYVLYVLLFMMGNSDATRTNA